MAGLVIPLSEPRNRTKAAVLLDDRDGRPVVVKSVEAHSWLRRRLLSGPLLRREGRALARLSGVPGVPRLLHAEHDRIEIEWIAGTTLSSIRKEGIGPEAGNRVRAAVAAFHAQGWAHGDLGARDVILTDDGGVVLIDMATAVGPGFPPLLWRILLPLVRMRDRRRTEKILRRLLGKQARKAARRAGARGG